MNRLKFKIVYVLASVAIFVFVPMIIARIAATNAFKWMSSDNDWIGFWGGYLGGTFTLAGVIISINRSRKEVNSNQRLSIMPYLAILDDKIMDEAAPVAHISLINVPEESVNASEYHYFFKRLVIKGILKSIGMGHVTNCKVDSIFIENKRIKYATGKQSVIIQNQETPFIIELLDFGLLKEELTPDFSRNFDAYFSNCDDYWEQPNLHVKFEIHFEDVLGNKYKQRVLYGFIIPTEKSYLFDDENCYYFEISKPECYLTVNNS